MIEDLDDKLEKAKKEIEDTNSNTLKAVEDRKNEDGDRSKNLEKLNELRKKREGLKADLKQYERSDPKMIEKLKKNTQISKDSVNRWVDNLNQLGSWIKEKKQGCGDDELAKSFPVFKNLDYVD